MGPFFKDNISFRPGVEYAFGEVTKLFGINLDALYQLRNISRNIRWAPYLGIGPHFSISHRNFENEVGEDIVDFGDWDWNNGLNFIVGVKSPGGASFELKATAWSNVSIRLLGGMQF
jgi:hypothetical protein